jgi:hypothetical protein
MQSKALFPLTLTLSLRERFPRKELLTLCTPEPGKQNIQHPTSNIEHPRIGARAIIGRWMLDVGCWMFPGFMGREPISPVLGYTPDGEHFPALQMFSLSLRERAGVRGKGAHDWLTTD